MSHSGIHNKDSTISNTYQKLCKRSGQNNYTIVQVLSIILSPQRQRMVLESLLNPFSAYRHQVSEIYNRRGVYWYLYIYLESWGTPRRGVGCGGSACARARASYFVRKALELNENCLAHTRICTHNARASEQA